MFMKPGKPRKKKTTEDKKTITTTIPFLVGQAPLTSFFAPLMPSAVPAVAKQQELTIASGLTKKNFVAKMDTDIEKMSAALHAGKTLADFSFPPPQKLIGLLMKLRDFAVSLDKVGEKNAAQQKLRLFIFLVTRHQFEIYAGGADVSSLQIALPSISETIGGVVPSLNQDFHLPDMEFLPTADKIKEWQKQPCLEPGRSDKAGRDQIKFFDYKEKSGRKTSAPRAQLSKDLASQSLDVIPMGKVVLILNFPDFSFLEKGLMHADHIRPSADLIKRQKEMILAMNIDPSFRAEMEKIGAGKGYFLDDAGTVEGSYWFYESAHNDMNNLWYLSAADNSGDGKLATDPVAWLASTTLGAEYLLYLKATGQAVDTSKIICEVSPSGTSLKESFTTWARLTHGPLIKTSQTFTTLKYQLMEQAKAAESEGKAYLKEVRHRVHLAHELGSFFPPAKPVVVPIPDPHSDAMVVDDGNSDADSIDTQEHAEETALVFRAEHQALQDAYEKAMAESKAKAAVNIKKRKAGDDEPPAKRHAGPS